MKKKIPIIASILVGGIFLTGCNKYIPETEQITPIRHYLVGFYVDGNLYKTIQVEENKTIAEVIEAPKKDGFVFKGWQLEDGSDFDFSTAITSSISLHAYYELNGEGNPHEGENELNVRDEKKENVNYSFVIGWYSKTGTSGLDEKLTQHFYSNVINYLKSEGVSEEEIANISFRDLGEGNVSTVDQRLSLDGDFDMTIGLKALKDFVNNPVENGTIENVKMGEKTDRRIHLFTSDNPIANKLFEYLKTPEGQMMFDYEYHYGGEIDLNRTVNFYVGDEFYLSLNVEVNSTIDLSTIVNPTGTEEFSHWATKDGKKFESTTVVTDNLDLYATFKTNEHAGEESLNVLETKEEGKTYSLVIAWYGNTSNSGLDITLTQHIYSNMRAYLESIGTSTELMNSITVRRYGETSDYKNANLAADLKKDGDVDLLFGPGGAITNVFAEGEILKFDKTLVLGEATSRSIAVFTENELANKIFDFSITETGKQIFNYNYHFGK